MEEGARMRKKLQNVVDGTLLRFLIVGVINTIFGTSVMFAAYNLLGFGYWVSSALNYIFGGILSYFLNKYLVNERKKSPASCKSLLM